MEAFECGIHQVFVKLLDGKHKILNFETSLISVSALKHRIQSLTSVPSHHQLLLSNNSQILRDDQSLTLTPSSENPIFSNSDVFQFGEGKFPMVVHMLLRLRGGKGGFGSLLRGAATKAGQKKTNNFDACRDMSGRRLRHVNAEKKLEEWRAEAEERKLEKMAEDFLKKNAKEVAKSGKRNGSDSSEKYVAKYREQSAKCMEEVEKSVRESVKLSSKRKGSSVGNESDSKRLKIWLGKRKFGESDSDSEDDSNETEEGENEISVVIDNGSQSDSRKEADRSSGLTTGRELEPGSRDQDFSGSSSEEEDIVVEKTSISGRSLDGSDDALKCIGSNDPVLESLEKIVHEEANTDSKKEELIINPLPSDLASELDTCAGLNSTIQSEAFQKESVSASGEAQELDKPLNIDEYHSAAELEVLGMERLKSELQAQGLKCGVPCQNVQPGSSCSRLRH